MFKHLLVPTDGSPTSQLAVDKAIGLARAFSSAVRVLFVIDPYPLVAAASRSWCWAASHSGCCRTPVCRCW